VRSEEINSNSEAETIAWAQAFAQQLKPGDTIALKGNLGAGKTVICRGIARGLGFEGNVHSPSYALVHEYLGVIPIFHLDLYRLSENADWEEIGLDHYFQQPGICLIEWPERLPGSFSFTYRIDLFTEGEELRRIRLTSGS
jgi:tRNA threonylcarbamoyladenosine biosynthesis protein TsaE